MNLHIVYLVAAAALGLVAARGVYHLYGAILRRSMAIRTPDGRAARIGCFPPLLAFILVLYSAQRVEPWVAYEAALRGKWAYWAAAGIMGFFPAVFFSARLYFRRADISALRTGILPDGTVRSDSRSGEPIAPAPADGLAPLKSGSVLFVELAVFHSLDVIRPAIAKAIYGFALSEPTWERPLRGAYVSGGTLHLAGFFTRPEGAETPTQALLATAALRDGIEHEFVRRISLSSMPAATRLNAVRIYGLDGEGALVLDIGAKRERVAPGSTPTEPLEWSGFLRAGKIIAAEKIAVSVVSFQLFEPERVQWKRLLIHAADLGGSVREVALIAPPPASARPGPAFFAKKT